MLFYEDNRAILQELCCYTANQAYGVQYDFSSSTTLLATARDSGVWPSSSSKSGRAPFSRSSLTTLSSPFSAARDNGV